MFISAIGNSQSIYVQNQHRLNKTSLHNTDNSVSFKANFDLDAIESKLGNAFKNFKKKLKEEFPDVTDEEWEAMQDASRLKEAERAEENWIRS